MSGILNACAALRTCSFSITTRLVMTGINCYANSPICPASNWMSSDHECSWFGVSCDEGDKVTEIKFESNNVAGSLPDEISALSSLKVLSLEKGISRRYDSFNAGSNSPELMVLDLDYNAIGGSIPVEIFRGNESANGRSQ